MKRELTYLVVLVPLLIGAVISFADDDSRKMLTSTRHVAVSVDSSEPVQPVDNVEGEFIMHEWGTFTTFSGSDGVFLDFRPLAQEHSDLPAYVLDRANFSPLSLFTKSRLRGRVRMETPVTYFYTDRIRSVDVSVDFPKGLLTEFYPPVREIAPPFNAKVAYKDGEPIGNSSLNWGKVDLIPKSALVPTIADADLQNRIAEQLMWNAVPHGSNEHHYAHARGTDSALVHVRPDSGQSYGISPKSHFEKFLFYRGVGSFELPVAVTFEGDAPLFVNRGERPIRSVILIDSRDGIIHATKLEQVAAGEQQRFEAVDLMNVDQLADLVRESLVDEGLYAKEAQSMVNTWRDSWFAEEGRRVLYMVPGEVTEELLPLHIKPAPQERLRVLVGRMEIMSPSDESKLTELVRKSLDARVTFETKHDQRQRNAKKYPVPESIRTWGRMVEPALTRIAKTADELPVQREAEQLLNRLRTKG